MLLFLYRDFPDYSAYTVPVYFQFDWLNEYWDKRADVKDDYRFVYIGPKGSWLVYLLLKNNYSMVINKICLNLCYY